MIDLIYDGEVVDTWNDQQCSWNDQLIFVNVGKKSERLKFLLTLGTFGNTKELTHKCEEISQIENCLIRKDEEEVIVKAILFNEGETIAILLEEKS